MDIAHESTHAKQVDSGRDARFYKKLSDGDVDYARTTECKLAKKALKTNKSINIDCYPIYYEMLAKALK